MTARSRLTQRALVQRLTPGAIDDGQNPGPSTWSTLTAALPCWLYSSTEREAVTEQTTAVVTELKMMVPLAADVGEQDRISQVKDRRGTVIEDGLLHVERVLYKRSHKQLALSRVAG